MSVGPKLGVFGRNTRVLTNGVRAHVSRVGTHRSNEWEGRHGERAFIHAARDK
jgi:hypothetical protein